MRFGHRVIHALFWLYKTLLSPWLGENCRFHPTCSEYCKDALCTLPIKKSLPLIIKRILRCNPWSGAGGFDPVPKSD